MLARSWVAPRSGSFIAQAVQYTPKECLPGLNQQLGGAGAAGAAVPAPAGLCVPRSEAREHSAASHGPRAADRLRPVVLHCARPRFCGTGCRCGAASYWGLCFSRPHSCRPVRVHAWKRRPVRLRQVRAPIGVWRDMVEASLCSRHPTCDHWVAVPDCLKSTPYALQRPTLEQMQCQKSYDRGF